MSPELRTRSTAADAAIRNSWTSPWFDGTMAVVVSVIEQLVHLIDGHDPGGLRGFYVFGSSVAGALRPDSDLDLLMITTRSLDSDERLMLLEFLRQFSGRQATVTAGRPVELTSLVLDDVLPWNYPPMCDFLYGEWLRAEFRGEDVPERHANPDLAVLLTTVRQHSRVVRGTDPAELLPPIPASDLRRAIYDSVPELLDNLIGDERNVLLTLARMLVTLSTGDIVAKDEAARRVIAGSLTESDRSLLTMAAGGYLGEVEDDWAPLQSAALATATSLAARIRDIQTSIE